MDRKFCKVTNEQTTCIALGISSTNVRSKTRNLLHTTPKAFSTIRRAGESLQLKTLSSSIALRCGKGFTKLTSRAKDSSPIRKYGTCVISGVKLCGSGKLSDLHNLLRSPCFNIPRSDWLPASPH